MSDPIAAPSAAEPAIRPATRADLGAIQRIYAHYVVSSVVSFEDDPPAVADWNRRLDDLAKLGLPFLVAETVGETHAAETHDGETHDGEIRAGEVAGYAYATAWRPRPAYRHTVENSIYLDPAHTGRGIGRALLGALLIGCRAAGARQVIAVIANAGDAGDAGDAASVALHGRAGFAHVGRLTAVGHKHGQWVDTVLMQCDLTAGAT